MHVIHFIKTSKTYHFKVPNQFPACVQEWVWEGSSILDPTAWIFFTELKISIFKTINETSESNSVVVLTYGVRKS